MDCIPLKETVPCSDCLRPLLRKETYTLFNILLHKITEKYNRIFYTSNDYNKITVQYIVHCLENIHETISYVADYFCTYKSGSNDISHIISDINSRRLLFSRMTNLLITRIKTLPKNLKKNEITIEKPENQVDEQADQVGNPECQADERNINHEMAVITYRAILSVRSRYECVITVRL